MPNQADIADIVQRVGELPAMPAVVSEVLRLTDDPSTHMDEVSGVIQSDPALTTKILRVSNSAYYGMKQFVGTLKLATVILGFREIRNIVLGVSVFEALRSDKVDMELVDEIWNDSLQVAGLAKSLSTEMALGLRGEEFSAGLLTDLGKLVLLRDLGEEYSTIRKQAGGDPVLLCVAEQERMGCTHPDIALALSTQWNLPQALSDALWRQYPHPDRAIADSADPNLTAVVRIAKAATRVDLAAPEGNPALLDGEAWATLSDVKNLVPEEGRSALLAGYMEALKLAPRIPL